jgi:hypothetical protein
MGWRTWLCSPHMLRGVLWLIDTTAVVFAVEDAFARLLLLLEGVSTLFRTLALSLVRLVPTLLARVDDGMWICTYPSLPPSSGY